MKNANDMNDIDKIDNKWNKELNEYIKEGKPSKKDKAKAWKNAMGLQDVDGLKPSEYLISNAKSHIEGEIDIYEVKDRIKDYYKASNERKKKEEKDSYEADIVSANIAEILNDSSFTFSPLELINIHKKLFKDVYNHAGKFRDYNITKKEWVLDGDTVTYASYENLENLLKYDFEEESKFSYKDLSKEEIIKHLSKFVSNIWQVHPFSEGNTRTIAVFMIKYLKTFGFDIKDEMFATYSWYFRNALVRSNYRNVNKNVYEDNSFLEMFFYNLLINPNKYELKNRYMHVNYKEESNNKNDKGNDTKITLKENVILDLIKDNPNITQEEIKEKTGMSLRTVKSLMKDMQDKKIIERQRGKKNSFWVEL